MRFSLRFTSFLQEDEVMNLLTAKEAAQYLHVSLFTLGRIEKRGLLVPFRTPGGHRRYRIEMLDDYLEGSRARPARRDRRILVVDDGQEALDILARGLSSCEFSVASDELSVGMKLAEFEPDLILVNTVMSGLDAIDLCRRLDGREKRARVLTFEAPRGGEEGTYGGRGFGHSGLGVLRDRIEQLLEKPWSGES
ncbi:MAG: hypothetical protein CEE40_08385 [Chloroflexi bacterium B3_Chlor]|nr:MAG: hypothetical protein CEE40_08385 [Chloroflexi bacterium B3_Chlor]